MTSTSCCLSLLAAVASIFLLLLKKCEPQQLTFSQKFCQEHSEIATLYEYDNKIVGFANATKYILFTAKFELTCTNYDPERERYEFVISFINLATKIRSNASTPNEPAKRLRKIPIQSTVTTTSTTTTRVTWSRPADDAQRNEDTWFPLSLWPVRFFQSLNGTITDIFIHKSDHDRQSEDQNIKKAIVFTFQTFRSFTKGNGVDVIEDDDIGQHFSQYSIENRTTNFLIKKSVQPGDFVRLQFDDINFNQIGVYLTQTQSVSPTDGLITTTQGRISTQPTTRNDKLPFGVVVTYKMAFIGTSEPNYLEHMDLTHFVHFTSENFTKQHFDNSDNLHKIFLKKLENLRKLKVNMIINEIWKGPELMSNNVTQLKSVLALESELFVSKTIKRQDVLIEILPLLKQNFELAQQMQRWKVLPRLLEVASGCLSPEVDQMFLDVLRSGELAKSLKFAQRFLNSLAQYQYPSDAVLEHTILLATEKAWPSKLASTLSLHSFVDLCIMATRATISNRTRLSAIDFIASKLAPFATNCSEDANLRFALISAVNSVVVPRMLQQAEQPTRRLIGLLLQMMATCHESDDDVLFDSLKALRNVLDDDQQVQPGLRHVLQAVKCKIRADIVEQLSSLADSGLTQTDVGSFMARRTWPKHGFKIVDAYLLDAVKPKPRKDSSNGDFWCRPEVVDEYFAKKSAAHMRRHFYEQSENSHKIHRRQLDLLSSLTGTGGSGGGGSSLSPNFAPELNCQQWDSNIGRYAKEVYENPGKFDRDKLLFGLNSKHCLFNATLTLGSLGSAGFKAGFFSGRSNNSDGRLFGRTWMGVDLILNNELASVEFSREQLDRKFSGRVTLKVVNNVYIDEIQYTCNVTVRQWRYSTSVTTPAFRLVFSGFAFIMNADLGIGVNLTFWPSHCGSDGSMGVRFQPYVWLDADAYAELENDYFGIGTLATLSINYYVELNTLMPTGCVFFYHGNDQMIFKFDFYLKLPTFAFINFDPVPVVLKQAYAILTWQFVVKKSSRYVIWGYCFPGMQANTDTPDWRIGDESPDEYLKQPRSW